MTCPEMAKHGNDEGLTRHLYVINSSMNNSSSMVAAFLKNKAKKNHHASACYTEIEILGWNISCLLHGKFTTSRFDSYGMHYSQSVI